MQSQATLSSVTLHDCPLQDFLNKPRFLGLRLGRGLNLRPASNRSLVQLLQATLFWTRHTHTHLGVMQPVEGEKAAILRQLTRLQSILNRI
jgi:hypothetical protein